MDSHTWYNGFFVIFVILVHVVGGLDEPAKCHPDELQVLLKFKDGRVFNGYESWQEGEDCCNWDGVICNFVTGYVVRLEISKLISGEIPQTLGNLSRLEFLGISGNQNLFPLLYTQHLRVYANSLGWLSSLRALNYLSFSGVDLGKVGPEWMEVLGSFPSLKYLYLQDCNLQGMTPTQAYTNLSSSLSGIGLSYNNRLGPSLKQWLLHSNMSSLVGFYASATNLNGSIADMFFKFPKLEVLDLSDNFFTELPISIATMNDSLKTLNLADNMIAGAIPIEVGLLQNLRVLDLGNHVSPGVPRIYSINRFEGALPDSLCHLQELVELSLQSNALNGPIPECLGLLPSLGTLLLDNNRLEGNLPVTLGQLSRLSTLRLGSNNLEGQVTEGLFQNLTQLAELDISSNFFKIQFPSNWVPPFKGLQILYLDSCLVGPDYPPWIRTLPYLSRLDLSNSSIEGFLPQWFSESSCWLSYLDLSNNKIQGMLPNLSTCTIRWRSSGKSWDLSNNYLHGPIPLLNATFYFLDLSFNQFGGSIPSSLMSDDILRYSIDLSHNQLVGEIPSNIGNCTNLLAVDLSGNHLSGQLPVSMGNLQSLVSLHLGDNNLSGMLPWELSNVTSLMTLDLGSNRFAGKIPKWIGESLSNLRLLRLSSNAFSMDIPKELMSLQYLRVLDVSYNHLSGTIPRNIGNLTTMRTRQSFASELLLYGAIFAQRMSNFGERLDIRRNKLEYKYTKTLSLVLSLDLSKNNLTGEIPSEVTDLVGLIVLDLSHNQFSGLIPENIGNLVNLDTLILCENRLSGIIPLSLTHIPRLVHLNLSHNNLSGNIPMSPQLQTLVDPSIYDGNNGLCGFPLLNSCEVNKTNASSSTHTSERDVGIYVSVVVGFVAGFWCLFGPVLFKRSIRVLYFQYIDRLTGMM